MNTVMETPAPDRLLLDKLARLEQKLDAILKQSQAAPPPPVVWKQPPIPPRKLDVLRLVAQGQSNRQIADTLFLSPGTVKNYLGHICRELEAKNRWQAVRRAQEIGLLD